MVRNISKKLRFSIYSHKSLNGHDCIRADEAVDFVKSLGYDVVHLFWEKPLSSEEYINLKKRGLLK